MEESLYGKRRIMSKSKEEEITLKCGISCLLDQCNYVTVNRNCTLRGSICEYQRPLIKPVCVYTYTPPIFEEGELGNV